MNDQSHNSRPSAGSKSTVILLGIVLLPVLYALSCGPMIMLQVNGLLGPEEGPLYQSLAVLYTPLGWCLEYEIPGLAPALLWYISLWTG